MAGPAGTPPAIVNRLHGWMSQALTDQAFKQRLEDLGMEAVSMNRDDYLHYSTQEITRWAEHVKAAGVEPQN